MIKTLEIETTSPQQFIDITSQVQSIIRSEDISAGMLTVYVTHTTCGVTINENADPDVKRDMLMTLDRLVPVEAGYCHAEGNAHAHIKSSIIGSSVNVFVESSTLVLGTWQGVFLTEFDGPRRRVVLIKILRG
ncbi:MAG: secondary thiamine-phosphate synthase enzyme YjbQ [Thermodesulfobacteriota bacterium]|nr:secondary thiamine-phosphate synthase enzyme YjbQ [Thermodesulfobacteriota bacterium]